MKIYTKLLPYLALIGQLLVTSVSHSQVVFADVVDRQAEVSPDLIAQIEKTVELPPEAAPLAKYKRYYASVMAFERPMILGVYELQREFNSSKQRGQPVTGISNAFVIQISDIPWSSDGGCSKVTLYFDLIGMKFLRLGSEEENISRVATCNNSR